VEIEVIDDDDAEVERDRERRGTSPRSRREPRRERARPRRHEPTRPRRHEPEAGDAARVGVKPEEEGSAELADAPVEVRRRAPKAPRSWSEISPAELAGAANAGIGLQLDSLREILITVPVPAIAGLTFDSLSLHGDRGYVVAAGQIH
jgi:hypothetical protein